MPFNGENYKLTELIDLKMLQEFQDIFAKTMDLASLVVDSKGPVTKPSNFTDFCMKYTRGSEKGFNRCNECDIKWGKLAALKKEPVIYQCSSGLTDFAVPIIVEGQHIGSILGGQVLTAPPDEEKFREIAREYQIDEEEYIDALRKIPVVSKEKIDNAAHLLFIVANAISEIGLKNLKLIRKSKREQLYRTITETIRASLNIEKTKQQIVKIICEILNADRCFIADYDEKKEKFLIINDEYRSSEDVLSIVGEDVNVLIPNFADALKSGVQLIINDKKIVLDTDNLNFEKEKIAIEKYGVNAAFGFPLFYKDSFLGVLSIQYVNSKREIDDDDINLITNVSNQVAQAIYQARLYKITRIQAEREKINRNIIEILRGTLDRNTIKELFVQNIREYFEADRVFFADFDYKTNMYLPVDEHSESLSSDTEASFVGYRWDKPYIEDYIKPLVEKKELIIPCWNEYVAQCDNTLAFIDLFENSNVKSSYNLPVLYLDKIMGYFCIEYTHQVNRFTEEDLNTIRNICKQAAIALYHSDLYRNAKEAAQAKEEFIANISNDIRTPLNIIIELSELLLKSDFDKQKQSKYLDNINKSARELLDLTNDLIQMSKIEAENVEIIPEEFDSTKLIVEVASSLKLVAEKKKITFDTILTNHLIKTDQKLLKHILYNISNSSISFSASNKIVLIESICISDEFQILVEFACTGMAKDAEDMIFDEFAQLNASCPRGQECVGLSLTITKKLVGLLKGEIHLESIDDCTCRFILAIPKELHFDDFNVES